MVIRVSFYAYFKELTGCSQIQEELPPASTLQDLLAKVIARFPRLAAMDKSILVAVGVEYQDRSYILQPGEEVSLFPPVQGG